MQLQPDSSETRRKERIATRIFTSSVDASKAVAAEIASLIRERAAQGKNAVLGLATGSSPVRVYDELVRLHREDGLSFRNVVTFNLDEYYPMEQDALQSYVRFMNEHLFDHVDVARENVYIPDGRLAVAQAAAFCEHYEKEIQRHGGIDIQILGIGRTGHIGFNEPGSGADSKTRMVTLDRMTRRDAASDFFSEDNVPRRAITMGVGTIMTARRILLMAWGEGKSRVIKRAVEGDVSDSVPATFLQRHFNTLFVVDEAAGAELTRMKTPWLVGECEWTEERVRTAVVWLCQQVEKPILKLSDEDYNEYGMGDLLTARGTAYDINIHIFNQLQRTVTGWPGGKPNADDSNRPERAAPFPKRVVIFSPHPDDDVISMGGTFIRLADHGHDVHVAYQTSGNIAVFDDDAIRFADFVLDMNKHLGLNAKESENFYQKVSDFLRNKKPGEIDSPEVQAIKGLIRQGEAKAGCRASGISDKNAHFLNMPFYQTGTVKKNPIGEDDIRIVMDLLNDIKPHQIYAAGDLSDPHGTHRVCLAAIMEAVRRIKSANSPETAWIEECWVWLYRGAWQEWGVDQIEMAVPISPQELLRKRKAIFKHQSQKDAALFPGSDPREFWQRAEDRNRGTAEMYNKLGLAEYEAIEGFVRWKF
jgi:glucosamine-6-phosphate deaminase